MKRLETAHKRHRGRLRTWLLSGMLSLIISAAASAQEEGQEEEPVRLQITDPYIEFHTGQGDVYPIFYVEDRGEWIEIIIRKTDWFKVRTDKGVEGWVSRKQLERTLTEAGVATSFRDILLEDYLRRRLEIGMSGGTLDGDPVINAHVGYKINDNVSAEFSVSNATGSFSSSLFYHVNVVSQPFPDWQYSPFFTLGVGRFENKPRATLVNAVDTKATALNAGFGVRTYITERFFARAQIKEFVVLVDDDQTDAFQEILLGLAFFF